MTACPNQSAEEEFYILAFSASPVGEFSIFFGVLLIYLLTILGNLTIIILVYVTPDLHTPMYFFLSNLSLVDVTSSSTYIPKLLVITLTQDHKISFYFCMIQLFFSLLCIFAENLILTSMAYDRYLAICKPLQYYLIMSKKLSASMAASYGFIFSNIVKIHSRDGHVKAFSTCISHLITVILFYVPSIFLYLKQELEHTKEQDKLFSMLYLLVVPMLNPLVYSLRNKDIWKAFSKVKIAKRKLSSH